MEKKKLFEYLEGDPDTVYDTDRTKSIMRWRDENTISFGYFPITLDNEYELFIGRGSHTALRDEALSKLLGKAFNYIKDKFPHEFLEIGFQVGSKNYGLGRVWKGETNVMTFWELPSSKMVREVIDRLKIDPVNCVIVTEKLQMKYLENMTAAEYIQSGTRGEEDINAKINKPFNIKQEILEAIYLYNNKNKIWQTNKEKEGWKTLAQRNATIYQESKEDKNAIDMNKNRYKEEFSNYIKIMNEALERENFAAYEAARDMLDESIEDVKHEKALENELNTNNFGILNHIFEERLPELFKTNRKAVKNVIKVIKEDSNLLGQFNYYNTIKNYNGKISETVSPETMISKLNEAIVATINKDTVIKSNAKLRKVLKENNIVPNDFVEGEIKNLYESGHNILTKKTNAVGNVALIAESSENIRKYMDKHKGDKINEGINPQKLIKDFENKLKDTLTESEMSFVQQITDWRSPIAEQRKEKLFNKFKNECIKKLDEMLSEDKDNSELVSLKKQIEEQKFNKDSIVTDIAKLLEIRDILLDS